MLIMAGPDSDNSATTATETATVTATATAEQPVGRRLPRALTPFRSSGYRRLAIALVFSTFATGVWSIAMVWEFIRIGGNASQFSAVATASALGVIIPALLGGVAADRIPQKRILLAVAGIELLSMALVATLSLLDLTQLWMLVTVAFV